MEKGKGKEKGLRGKVEFKMEIWGQNWYFYGVKIVKHPKTMGYNTQRGGEDRWTRT